MNNKIPINDLARYAGQVHGSLLEEAIVVLESGYYVLGPSVRNFENAFAAYCRVTHCIGVGNGTDGLEIALRALGVGVGDRVMVAANAAMYGTTAVLAVGAEPMFADVDPATALLTPETIAEALEANPLAPTVLIVTHLYGRLARIAEIVEMCRTRGIRVVEDCAQAHGAADDQGAKAGSFGDISTFSFYPTKNLGAVGDGGAICTSDDALAERARQLRQYGWSSKYMNSLAGGRNSRLDELQAAFLSRLLPDLDRRNSLRRSVANRYSSRITNPAVATPGIFGTDHVAHLYVVQCGDRESLAAHLGDAGIATDVHYPVPDHLQPMHGGRYSSSVLPSTQQLCSRVLTLPCFPELEDGEVERVIAACNSWRTAGRAGR